MTRFLHQLAGIILFPLLTAASMVVIYVGFSTDATWTAALRWCAREQTMIVGGAVALFFLIMLYLLTAVRRRREKDQFLTFDREDGTISLSMRGINSFIVRAGSEVEAVVGLKARIVPLKNGIDVVLDTRIREGVNVQELCQSLQQRVREQMTSSLGIMEIRNIKVNVREIM